MDVRRIDRYLGRHFTDEVGDKICVRELINIPSHLRDWDKENFRAYFDLHYLEQRFDLQETLIYDFASHLGMVNHSMTWMLTEHSYAVDEFIHEVYGSTFKSPIGAEEIDTALMCYECQPELYYDIAMNILTIKIEEAIEELEENGRYLLGDYMFIMKEKEGT